MNDQIPGLYIHIPFCLSKCRYCGFYSSTDVSSVRSFLVALGREAAIYRELSTFSGTFDTLYIGGGTPSVLSFGQIEGIIASVRRAFSISEDAEITIEANPGDITGEMLCALRGAGANRLSIGVQSFSNDALTLLGRRHDAGQAEAAVKAARNAGFDNVSIDLIYGIPGQGLNTWIETLRMAVRLNPSHISCYQLTMEKGTPFEADVSCGKFLLPDEDMQADFFFTTSDFLQNEGYSHYEASNFAFAGRESRHNQKYWNHTPYLGLGPSAHSFTAGKRSWNYPDVVIYNTELQEGRLPIQETETLDMEKLRLEALFLALRTSRGLCIDEYRRLYCVDLLIEKKEEIERLARAGFLESDGVFLRPTVRGMAIADSLALL
jgi:oxygen-independent coproporphyrinogen-3 oxidase